jgi:hypothetical protein
MNTLHKVCKDSAMKNSSEKYVILCLVLTMMLVAMIIKIKTLTDDDFLGCCAVSSARSLPCFRGACCFHHYGNDLAI